MNKNEVLKRVEDILNKISLSKNHIEILPEFHLEQDLGIDSIGSVELVNDIEEEYNIEISDAEMDSSKTVNDIVNVIFQKTAVAA